MKEAKEMSVAKSNDEVRFTKGPWKGGDFMSANTYWHRRKRCCISTIIKEKHPIDVDEPDAD